MSLGVSNHGIEKEISVYPTVVVLKSKNGGVEHAIAIVDQFIFDSTQEYVLKLSQDSLD